MVELNESQQHPCHVLEFHLSCVRISSTKQITTSLLCAVLLRSSGYRQSEVCLFLLPDYKYEHHIEYSVFPCGNLILP